MEKQMKIGICEWCFEEKTVDGKTVCQACIDAVNRMNEENKDFDLDKWIEETDEEMIGRR